MDIEYNVTTPLPPDGNALHLEVRDGLLPDLWALYHLREEIEAMMLHSALAAAKQGRPALLIQLKEMQARCPNLPPIQKLSISTPWHN